VPVPADYQERPCVYAIIEGHCLAGVEAVGQKLVPVKLGMSAGHPSERLAELQTGNPRLLVLLAYTRHLSERAVHTRWRSLRRHGEWFDLDRTLLAELRTWDWLDDTLCAELAVVVEAWTVGT
jgi:hypothetical protein